MPALMAESFSPADAALATRTATPNLLDYASGLGGNAKKNAGYLQVAQMGMGMMDQPQQQMQAPQLRGPQGPGQQLQPPPMYGDPELEKRLQYEQWLAQQGGIYG